MAMEEADWDLLAVVRGFTSTATEAIQQPTPPPPPADHGGLISPSGYFEQPLTADGFQENKEAQLIFGNRASSPADASVFTLTSHLKPTATCSTPSQTHQRSKKRKSLQKRVCHVPVEGLSSDMWAWRKYGQKPIKGSPYPRGYYKCSSSKGCPARKQVERNKSEPKMLIVAYTSEHNHPLPTHRNSLAGSTRQKPNVEVAPKVDQENIESGDELELKEMVMNDDFFVGFEDLNDDSDCGDLFSHQIQGNLEEREPPPPL